MQTGDGGDVLPKEALINVFIEMGRDIFLRGLISSHAGNMSVRIDDKMYITKRGSMLGRLKPSDIVELEIDDDNPDLSFASSEVIVHSAVYKKAGAGAIIHAHPPYATLLSMTEERLIPCDSEGSFLFGNIPVVKPEKTIASEEAAEMVSACLKISKVVLVSGHGSFAAGNTLEEAHLYTSSLESSAFFLYHLLKM